MRGQNTERKITKAGVVAVKGSKTKTRLLSVLSDQENQWFLGAQPLEERFGTGTVVDYRAVADTHALFRAIDTFRPHIVIGAWSTPHFPPIDSIASVKLYTHASGSVRKQLDEEHFTRGLRVTNWGPTIAPEVAECALFLAIGALRRFPQNMVRELASGQWGADERPTLKSLFGKKIGIHGLGAIARNLIALLRPFGCQIRACDPYQPAALFADLGIGRCKCLDELLETSEVFFECCALTPETKGIINARRIGRMPADACFVNVARGQLVDESALFEAVKHGHIRAGLDVYTKEPLPETSPLRKSTEVVAIPHLGANTAEARRRSGDVAVENIQRFMGNRPLIHEITMEKFRRMT